ncbi:M-phase inducer phosphatase 1-B-like [Ruditapes philippinarum]|uniref:M-phase inducer phosphatase 1-B-like n=1 Tax=Ruditapes philippinarum TaxID=129788 RepID=UPI00295AA5CB|nr:M-phase inducer phosphatase 1-B-like [Ruditapes philippinarum]
MEFFIIQLLILYIYIHKQKEIISTMPPLPSDFTDVTLARNTRTRLDFGITGNDVKGPVKRQAESLDLTPTMKRKRFQCFTSTPKPEVTTFSPISSIIQAVDKLSTESDLIADGSRVNILPTIPGKHSDLSAISPETMSDVLDGVYDSSVDKVTVIDCRYPYEFGGGHIKGAVNLFTKESIKQFIQETVTSPTNNHVLIFHCEFSSERGPKMYRHLRALDRDLNKDNYPRLNFPEIYLLEGGYKAFFNTNKEQCFPQTYKPMLHKEHRDDLRHFRVKSKSWSAGDRPRKTSDIGKGLRLRF